MAPKPPPDLVIPPGNTAVTVSAIDSTLWSLAIHTSQLYDPPIEGFGRVRMGCWSLFIQHPSGRNLLYDLGMRKDYLNCPPAVGVKELLENGTMESINVEKNVSEILEEGGVGVSEGAIEGVIWSHFHFDHIGDASTFPKTTRLIVGEGFKDAFMPGYPTNPEAQTLDSDFEGREVFEVDFNSANLRAGNFRAYDYFGDGSFYLLDTPGHAVGHINALARTKVDPPEFIHLCGDSAHHCGEIRPSPYLPLPDNISLPHLSSGVCPGHLFCPVLRNGSKEDHILELKDPGVGHYKEQKYALIYDDDKLRETVREVEGFDANENVLTVLAHDWTLKGVIDEWPKNLNGWSKRGWRKESRWLFLEDFREAMKKE